MFRLDNFLEYWATIYKPLSHDPSAKSKHKTFYRIDRLGGDNEFARNFNTAPSPCMAFPTSIDAEMGKNAKQIVYHHGFYFMVKQSSATNGKLNRQSDLDAADCKAELDDLAQDLLAWLYAERKRATDPATLKDYTQEEQIALKGLALEEAKWWSVPELYNGWWVLGIEFDRTESRNLCVNPEDYITSESSSSSS